MHSDFLVSTQPTVEGEVAFFNAKHWDHRNRADLIESATPCHDSRVVVSYRVSNPLRLTVLAAKSEDYITAQRLINPSLSGNSKLALLSVKLAHLHQIQEITDDFPCIFLDKLIF